MNEVMAAVTKRLHIDEGHPARPVVDLVSLMGFEPLFDFCAAGWGAAGRAAITVKAIDLLAALPPGCVSHNASGVYAMKGFREYRLIKDIRKWAHGISSFISPEDLVIYFRNSSVLDFFRN